MNLIDEFNHSKGTVIGSMHRNNFKNNQDFHFFVQKEDYIIALVADGCGSGTNSEVGAGLIIPSLALELTTHLNNGLSIETSIQNSLLKIKNLIRTNALNMYSSLPNTIEHFFLFTIVGSIITKDETIIFSIGDGVYSINGSIHVIDENNAPNYIAYKALIDKDPTFVINVKMPTEFVDSIIIATDGTTDIINNKDQQVKVGLKSKMVGDLNQFVEGEMRGSSIRMIKHLNVLSKQNMVSDDTTIITITRTPKGE